MSCCWWCCCCCTYTQRGVGDLGGWGGGDWKKKFFSFFRFFYSVIIVVNTFLLRQAASTQSGTAAALCSKILCMCMPSGFEFDWREARGEKESGYYKKIILKNSDGLFIFFSLLCAFLQTGKKKRKVLAVLIFFSIRVLMEFVAHTQRHTHIFFSFAA